MSNGDKLTRGTYLSKNAGHFPAEFRFLGRSYRKIEDLRYGTNPHQPAASYRPEGVPCPVGGMAVLKSGKNGLSQTNIEDISQALSILKYFERPACVIMKHVNPCGFAVGAPGACLREVYRRARDCDPRAAFGGVAAFNVKVDPGAAEEIMSSFMECVAAPGYDMASLVILNDGDAHKVNRHIRVVEFPSLDSLPKFVGDSVEGKLTVKVLADGSIILSEPLLTSLRRPSDIRQATATCAKRGGEIAASTAPTSLQLEDLLTAWWINMGVRSNGVVIVKNGQALAVGTGEQDRVGAVEQAVWKIKNKYEGDETAVGAVMSSDGFFPFPDSIEIAAEAGVSAVIAPSGSLRDADVIARANELGVAMTFAPERIFSHH